jgi:hypothetical protein
MAVREQARGRVCLGSGVSEARCYTAHRSPFPKRRPSLEGPRPACCLVLRDRAWALVVSLPRQASSRRTLKTAQLAKTPSGFALERLCRSRAIDHRQDTKGMWWMPWHQEPKKDVDGCDKPR